MKNPARNSGGDGDIDRRLLEVEWDTHWSPPERAFIASSAEFATLTGRDAGSALAAITDLEDKIRRVLMFEPHRLLEKLS
ncbi:hypothetical protein [Nocardia mexicana]|uniref:Uncharacterized protein n=1 Tax=Nocardia mexicana TaxID=279262 RepID=A0A370GIX1_9NOCA|nr:hypothetical protein [Nocardia mexicana]RDI43320.1 hypothetical protein DFR68_12283 [Nocardia mexicana]